MQKNKAYNLIVFLVCVILVIIISASLIKPVLEYRLFQIPDDWAMSSYYRVLSDLPFLPKLLHIWKNFGLHDSSTLLYIGTLSDLFGFDYQAFQKTGLLFKILSVITVFPVILIIFKNRLLAFLTTITYAMNSGATGAFFWVMKEGQYVAITVMNIFFIFYYYTVQKNSLILLFFSTVLIFLSFVLSPPRMSFIVPLILLIELLLLLKRFSFNQLKVSLLRTLCLLLPILIFISQVPTSSCCPPIKSSLRLIEDVYNGNWQNILYPFAGIGFSMLTNDYWKFFGNIDQNTFKTFSNYLFFLLTGPTIIFVVLTAVLSPLLAKKPKKFMLMVLLLSFLLNILLFFIATHHFYIPKDLVMTYNDEVFLISKFPTILAFYILSLATAVFLEWRKNRSSLLLFALWVGPLFSFINLLSMWIIIGKILESYSSVNHLAYYHVISPIGLSLFLSAILVLLHEKSKKNSLGRLIVLSIITFTAILLYQTYKFEIKREFLSLDPLNHPLVSLTDQQGLNDDLFRALGESGKNGDLLVYIDLPNNEFDKSYYKRALVLDYFGEMINLRRSDKASGCIGVITDKTILQNSLQNRNGSLGFISGGACFRPSEANYGRLPEGIFYSIENFQAFKIEDHELINIKNNVFETLKNP